MYAKPYSLVDTPLKGLAMTTNTNVSICETDCKPVNPVPFNHGATGYSNHGCRCPICTQANRDYSRPRMAAWRAQKQSEK